MHAERFPKLTERRWITVFPYQQSTIYLTLCSCTLWRVVSTVTVRPEPGSAWHLPRFWRRVGDIPGREQPVCLLLEFFPGECLLQMDTLWCQVRNCDASYWTMFQYLLQGEVFMEKVRNWLRCWTMIPMQTSGPKWASSPLLATTTAWASCRRRLLTTASDVFKQRSVCNVLFEFPKIFCNTLHIHWDFFAMII